MRATSPGLASRRASATAMIGAKLQHQSHSRSASMDQQYQRADGTGGGWPLRYPLQSWQGL